MFRTIVTLSGKLVTRECKRELEYSIDRQLLRVRYQRVFNVLD